MIALAMGGGLEEPNQKGKQMNYEITGLGGSSYE
jgi:hypothetical protein